MRILGIDYGSARIGLALGDMETRIATPLAILSVKDREDAVTQVREIAEQEGIKTAVVGVPRPLRDTGRETEQAKEIREFIKGLKARGMSVEEGDETLSSKLAETLMRERAAKGECDDIAAAAILQTWLDKLLSRKP